MILQTKFKLEEDGWTLVRTISTKGMKIRQDETGELYDEAIDPDFTNRTYTETDIPVEKPVEEDELPDGAIPVEEEDMPAEEPTASE